MGTAGDSHRHQLLRHHWIERETTNPPRPAEVGSFVKGASMAVSFVVMVFPSGNNTGRREHLNYHTGKRKSIFKKNPAATTNSAATGKDKVAETTAFVRKYGTASRVGAGLRAASAPVGKMVEP